MTKGLLWPLVLAASLWGQLDGITVTAYRAVTLPPVEAVFNVTVTADQATTLDEVLAKLKELGISAQNLVNVNTVPYGPTPVSLRVTYGFNVTVPLDKLKEMSEAIARLRRTELELDIQGFNVGMSAGSAAFEEARKRVLPELLRDARARAEEYASAAQLKVGAIASVSESPSTYAYLVPTYPYVPSGGPVSLTAGFSLTVRFKTE